MMKKVEKEEQTENPEIGIFMRTAEFIILTLTG